MFIYSSSFIVERVALKILINNNHYYYACLFCANIDAINMNCQLCYMQ